MQNIIEGEGIAERKEFGPFVILNGIGESTHYSLTSAGACQRETARGLLKVWLRSLRERNMVRSSTGLGILDFPVSIR